MQITIEHHGDQFNVNLASKDGADAFLSIKGCRIVNGNKGEFVSFPASKSQSSGKWWNHVWASEKFSAAVMQAYQASKPKRQQRQQADDMDEAPF